MTSNNKTSWIAVVLILLSCPVISWAQDKASSFARYKALDCPSPPGSSTWTILDRDGGNRQVTPYLSSLGQGEAGTGVITSPPFHIQAATITFTICGHDGPSGSKSRNYIALVDARKGEILLKTSPPQNDAMQERAWDVKRFRDLEVRIEVHDANAEGAFAWMGIGRIDAGKALRIDFRDGMPAGWEQSVNERQAQFEILEGTIPFRRDQNIFTLIPKTGAIEIPCGFKANRLFFLGCTANEHKLLETFGGIEIHYNNGSPDVFPLMCGFTLEGRYKTRSPSKAMHLHASADPYQYYLSIQPRSDIIDKIRLVAEPDRFPVPRITAITCETGAESANLALLPETPADSDESDWIESHSLSVGMTDLNKVMAEIRKANRIPDDMAGTRVRFRKQIIDDTFRSEGVAVADFNNDKRLDIAVGSVIYTGPKWKPIPILSKAKSFNTYGYSDSFLCFPGDLNHDGAMDLIVVGFPGQKTHWLENPGELGAPWKEHLAINETSGETPEYVDIPGDGRHRLVCINHGKVALAWPDSLPGKQWMIQPLANDGDPAPAHGLGHGDINKDGAIDIICPKGWWENPEDPATFPWRFHPVEFFGGAQLCVYDIDGDGDNDVLGSSPHGYGIAWTEQTPDGWVKHDIDDTYSQTHAIHLADINRDGLMDFVTGKRFWAHNGHDPGSFQPSFLYWYEQQREGGRPIWRRHLIDANSGVGLHFQIVDMNGDGRLDIVTSNKKGTYYFEQIGS